MKMKLLVCLNVALLAGVYSVSATQTARDTWDALNLIGNLYPANTSVTNDPSSVGFVATSPWITNPDEHNNNTLISIRSFFPEPWDYGLPPNYDGSTVAICEDNSFPGNTGTPPPSLWTSGDWMVRQMAPGSAINFNANGEYYLEMHVGMETDAQYAGDIPATGAGGIGFADGATTSANFVAIGVTGTNLFLGPANGSNPWGTIPASKTDFISQGTLGQAGNPNSLIYNPVNDPAFGAAFTLTNFTGGPYFVNAFGTNRLTQLNGDGIMILGHLVTHAGGNATMQVKFYNVDDGDTMDITPAGITWDCSYSFNYSGIMSNMLVFENGEFPLYIYDFRVGTTLTDVVGMDSEIVVAPKPNVTVGTPLNLTNNVGLANAASNPDLSGNPNYGLLAYQWQQNGQNILNATNSYLNIASASTSDPAMPAGTDAGTYASIATDVSGIWGTVTSAPVVITVSSPVVPVITSVTPSPDLQTVVVTYSQLVNGAAAVPGNYALSGGVTVSSVSVATVNFVTVATLTTTTEPLATRLTLTINGVQNLAGLSLTPNTTSFWTDMHATGYADYYAWYDSSAAVSTPVFYSAYPSSSTPTPAPGFSATYTSWEAPLVNVTPSGGGATQNTTYGARMYGWFIPPVTTNYVFFVSADDACRLSLSTNSDPANLRIVAVENIWSPSDNWTNYSSAYPPNTQPPYAAHRGSGSNDQNPSGGGGFGGPGGDWDPGPDQNRSDEFLTALSDEISGAWPNETGVVYGGGIIQDVVQGSTQFWPALDSNGNALITLQAGQSYYMQADHVQEYGGGNLSVTYKFASSPGSRNNDPATGATSIMAGGQIAAIVPFAPSLSITIAGGSPAITYAGILSASTTVNGTYTDVPGASSPYHPTGAGTMFFRTHE